MDPELRILCVSNLVFFRFLVSKIYEGLNNAQCTFGEINGSTYEAPTYIGILSLWAWRGVEHVTFGSQVYLENCIRGAT